MEQQKRKTCLIISGGEFSSVRAKDYDLIIAADKGAEYARRLSVSPDVILGDFDSLSKASAGALQNFTERQKQGSGQPGDDSFPSGLPDAPPYAGRSADMSDTDLEIIGRQLWKDDAGKDLKIIKLPEKKDDTDTMAAIRYAIGQNCTSITVCCIMGGRFDHMLANLQAAAFAAAHDVPISLIGDRDEIHVFRNTSMEFPKRKGWSLSVFALSDTAENVTITGAAYCVRDLSLTNAFPLGVSNTWAEEKAVVCVKEGILAVILSKIPY